jgi:hypothetical protein
MRSCALCNHPGVHAVALDPPNARLPKYCPDCPLCQREKERINQQR